MFYKIIAHDKQVVIEKTVRRTGGLFSSGELKRMKTIINIKRLNITEFIEIIIRAVRLLKTIHIEYEFIRRAVSCPGDECIHPEDSCYMRCPKVSPACRISGACRLALSCLRERGTYEKEDMSSFWKTENRHMAKKQENWGCRVSGLSPDIPNVWTSLNERIWETLGGEGIRQVAE